MTKITDYQITLPANEPGSLDQNEAFFYLEKENEKQQILFHDYETLYNNPGLYEQLYMSRLQCQSPQKITALLKKVENEFSGKLSERRVLDVGAGNGIVGEELRKIGVARIVGVDILEAAQNAAKRDRPTVYDSYYAIDLTRMTDEVREELKKWHLDCMVTVSALGYGDIPCEVFIEAFNLVAEEAMIAFNIKETFFDESDTTGFSILIKKMILKNHLEILHLEKYKHRLSIDGKPLYYYAIIGRKKRHYG